MRYKIQAGRVQFADYVQRRQLVDEGRLLKVSNINPDKETSLFNLTDIGKVNTTPEQYAQYLADIASTAEQQQATVPDAPTGLSATPGFQQLIITFTEGSNGGSAITNYQYSTDGGSTFIALSPSASSSPITITTLSSDGVTALTNGTTYTVQLKAVNSVGASIASDSITGTPSSVPDAPTGLSATFGNQQVTVSFTAGAGNGSAITNYQYSTDNGTTFRALSPVDAASPVTITTLSSDGVTALTNGTTYTIRLKALNANGASVASSSVTGIPSSTPSAPTGLSGTAGNQQVVISFTAGSDGGSAITNYQYSTDNGTTFIALSPADSVSPITITTLSTNGSTALTNGTSYTIRLKAVNANGVSVASASVSVTPSTTPSAPTGLSGSPDNQQAIISFTAGSNGGSAITNYQYSTDGGSTFLALSPADSTSPVTITTLSSDGTTPLSNGTAYTILLKAVNANGVSVASASVTVTPAPGIDVIILGDASVTTLSSSLQSAKTALGLSPALTITTQQLNGYTGTNLSSFQVCILYTNGGLNLNATLGTNLNNFVAAGGHLIMGSFAWGNVSAITNFNYNSYSTYAYKGTYSSVNVGTAVYTVTHPITTGVATSTGAGSQNIPNPITLTTTPSSQTIATYGDNTTAFIAVGQVGSARLVGINLYFAGSYSGLFQNTINYVCRAIYWCRGII